MIGCLSKTKIAEKFGIPKSTLSTIIKKSEKINKAVACVSFGSKVKRLREARYENVETLLYIIGHFSGCI